MRKIDGFVCIATAMLVDNIKKEILFGANVHFKGATAETFQDNGLVPFTSLKMARKGERTLITRKDFKNVKIAKIVMQLIETEKDIPLLIAKKNLVVAPIVSEHSETTRVRLMGRYVKGRPSQYPLPGAQLELNGLKPFPNYGLAQEAANEASRQMDRCQVLIGTFELKRL